MLQVLKMKKWFFKFSRFFSTIKNILLLRSKEKFRYTIVDFIEGKNLVFFSCGLTRATFSKKLIDAVYDQDIICNLRPEQASYLGMVIGREIKNGRNLFNSDKPGSNTSFELLSYSCETNESSLMFDRCGNMIFVHPKNKGRCVMRPEYVVSRKETIDLFHPTVAFRIGVYVGGRRKISSPTPCSHKNLRLIKSAKS